MSRKVSFLVALLAGCLPPPPEPSAEETDLAETDSPQDTDCEPSTWFADVDEDGYGGPTEVQACEQPVGHVAVSGDCDDADGAVHPGAPDPTNDLVDGDCDGEIGCGDLDCDGYADVAIAAADDVDEGTHTSGLWMGDERGISDDRHRPVAQPDLSSVAAGDVDGDGSRDLVFAQILSPELALDARTFVFFGPEFDVEEIARIPTVGARGVDLADVDGDGTLEIIVAQGTDGSDVSIDSVVLAMDGSRYEWTQMDAVPTEGARAVLAEDFDGDGFVDLAFANEHDGATFEIHSSIYWGGADGFSTSSRTRLATAGASGLAAADLDLDGDLDLVIANRRDDVGHGVDSLIFWNDDGFEDEAVTRLPTRGARDVAAADLDHDGAIDLVFANERDSEGDFDTTSTIYWSAAGTFAATEHTELDTQGAAAVDLADADGDGHTDVIFANGYGSDDGTAVDSVIYWGAGSRAFEGRTPTRLDTNGASAVVVCPGGERCR